MSLLIIGFVEPWYKIAFYISFYFQTIWFDELSVSRAIARGKNHIDFWGTLSFSFAFLKELITSSLYDVLVNLNFIASIFQSNSFEQ